MPKSDKNIQQKFLDNVPKLAKKWCVEENEIIEAFSKELANLPQEEKEKERIAWRRVLTEFEKIYGSWRSPAVPIFAYIVGESGLQDAVETKLKPHSRAIGFVDANGTELDYREKIFGDTPNPQFNQPYQKPEYEREIYAIVSNTPDFKECSLARLLARYDVAESINIKCWKFYKVRVTVPTKEDPSRKTYNLTKASKFVEYDSGIMPYELINKIETISVSEAISAYDLVKNLKPYEQAIYAIKGFVMGMQKEARKEDSKYITMRIGDETGDSIVAFFPKFFEFNMGESSDIVVFGTFFAIRDAPAINAVGYLLGEIVL